MTRPFCIPVESSPSFSGQTLILPVVSIGSVPQLSVDLLIHTPALEFERVAYLDAADCIPFVSPGEGRDKDDVFTALDVYQSKTHAITVVQQRSPVLKTRKADFVTRLMKWIDMAQFADILVLASIDAAFRNDTELDLTYVYLQPAVSQDTPLARQIASRHRKFGDAEATLPTILGAGLTRAYLKSAPPHTAALLIFCAEGDNRGDAHALAAQAAQLCHMPDHFDEPQSWETLFGAAQASVLYG